MLGRIVRGGLDLLAAGYRRATRVTRELRGMHVVLENPYPGIDDEFVLGRLDAALELIERRQPHRFRHFQRDVKKLWVTRYPARGVYFPAERMVMTEVTFLNRRDISTAQVASSILHEGVHARVHQMGVRLGFRRRWPMADEERLCRRAEIAFARTLPADEAAPLLARAEAVIRPTTTNVEAAPVVNWRDAHFNKFAADVEQLQLPAWAKRRLLAFGRWRLKPD